MLASAAAALAFAPATPLHAPTTRAGTPVAKVDISARPDLPVLDFTFEKPWTSGEISDKEGLKALATKLNPIVGYWDPLNIGSMSKETIGWFRHAEIKHGRVAMAAFVGYLVGASGQHFPGMLTTSGVKYADISAAGAPMAQWDALPSAAKCQILLAIGFLELFSESSDVLALDGQQHYVRGGKPGYFPKLKGKIPHPIPFNLWDPFGQASKQTPEAREKSLLAEINNGRLAMLGIFGLVSASKGLIVPGLDTLPFPKYDGVYMAPFSSVNSDLPFVPQMLAARAEQIAREAAILGDAYLNNGA